MICVEIKFTDIRGSGTNTAAVQACSATINSDDTLAVICTERYIRHKKGHWRANILYGVKPVCLWLAQTENANLE